MSATSAFGEQLDALGVWWPRGDGDALREHAAAWRELADFLEDVSVVLDGSARLVVENHRGEAAQRFADHWTRWQGADGYLGRTAADCRRIAAAADDFGGDIDTADRTLVRLVEEALARLDRPTTEWLRECATIVGEDLAGRAAVRCDGLAGIGDLAVAEPDETAPRVDRAAIDPSQITWSDLGSPEDYQSLATTAVDFGAGEGVLPPELTGVAPDPSAGLDGLDLGAGDAGIVINAPGATINIDTLDADATAADDTLGAGGGGGEAGLGGGAGGSLGAGGGAGGGGGGGSLGSFDATPDLPDIPVSDQGLELDPMPVEVEPPFAAAALAGTAGLGVAAAKSFGSGGGGRMPFFPMMPMAGGGSENESEEPRRRKRR